MDLIKAWKDTRKIRCPLCNTVYAMKQLENGMWTPVNVPNKIWASTVLQDGKGNNHNFGVCLACYRFYMQHNIYIKELIGTQPVLLRFNYQSYFLGSYFNYAVHESIPNPQTGFITYHWNKEKGKTEKVVSF